jgi:hypothetical protein
LGDERGADQEKHARGEQGSNEAQLPFRQGELQGEGVEDENITSLLIDNQKN